MSTAPIIDVCAITLIAPELTGDARLAMVLGMATRAIGYCTQMKPVYSDAVPLLAAHILTMMKRGATTGAVGGVNKAKAGEVEQGFSSYLTRNSFQQTPYGALYWQLVESFQVNPMVV